MLTKLRQNVLDLLLDEHFKLSKIKNVFEGECETSFSKIFNSTIAQIRPQVKVGKLRIRELRVEREETISSGKGPHEQQIAHKTFISKQTFYAQNLSREIEMRCAELTQKCNVELKAMRCFQILECQKNMTHWSPRCVKSLIR